jgi:hypothetical protein
MSLRKSTKNLIKKIFESLPKGSDTFVIGMKILQVGI